MSAFFCLAQLPLYQRSPPSAISLASLVLRLSWVAWFDLEGSDRTARVYPGVFGGWEICETVREQEAEHVYCRELHGYPGIFVGSTLLSCVPAKVLILQTSMVWTLLVVQRRLCFVVATKCALKSESPITSTPHRRHNSFRHRCPSASLLAFVQAHGTATAGMVRA